MKIIDGRIELTDREQQRREEFIAGLRDLADWYAARPGLPAPYVVCEALFSSLCFDTAELGALVREAGTLEKRTEKDSDYMTLVKNFGEGARFRLLIEKKLTCERVKVGTKVLPAIPAQLAKEETIVDVYEWQCDGSVLASLQSPDEAPAEAALEVSQA